MIVNAANSKLEHGSGVAGALKKAGGSAFEKQSREWIVNHGSDALMMNRSIAVTEGTGALKCKSVYHTVGPRNML